MTVVVTGLTAERMIEMEEATVIDGDIQGDNLHLQTRGGTDIDAGNVRGPKGDKGNAGTNGTNGTNGAGDFICTSTTRPASPTEGLSIYETDTDVRRTWTGTRWKLQERIICTSTTRPALVAADEGVVIYETNTNNEYRYDGLSLNSYGVTICTSSTRPATPAIGQEIYETDTGKKLYYQSAATGWTSDWGVPWGVIVCNRSTTDHLNISAEQNIAGMLAQWTVIPNRIYRTQMILPRTQQQTSAAEEQVFLCDASNAHIELAWCKWALGNEVNAVWTSCTELGLPAGSTTRKMRGGASNGSWRVWGAAYPGTITVEDMGPNGKPL